MKVELDLSNYTKKKQKISKLQTTPVDLSKLTDVAKNEVVEKTVYGESGKNVNAVQSSDATNLVRKVDYNTKITEI